MVVLCCCQLIFGFAVSPSFPLSSTVSPFRSLSPCQSVDLWLCLSEGHTSHPTLLFVSTPLHFSTHSPLKATRNQQKLTPGSYALSKVCFVALLVSYLLQRNLTGIHIGSGVVLTKYLAGPTLCVVLRTLAMQKNDMPQGCH